MSDWKYFSEAEMTCSHSGKCEMNPEFMAMLDDLREFYGKPMTITSAYRDITHPIEARKKKPGAHTYGRAVDVAVSGSEAHAFMQAVFEHGGFKRVGVQQKGTGRFIHLDNMSNGEGFPNPWVYSY